MKDDPFLVLKIKNIPRSAKCVELKSLVQAHFSEGTDVFLMRCSHCCEQQGHERKSCNVCKNRKTVEQCNLLDFPEFLIIQLIRNMGNESKLTTFVKIEEGHVNVSTVEYEMIGAVDHIGETPNEGHYVTFLKQNSNDWIKFDDEVNTKCSLNEANNENNYILLLKKKEQFEEQKEPSKVDDVDGNNDFDIEERGNEMKDSNVKIIMLNSKVEQKLRKKRKNDDELQTEIGIKQRKLNRSIVKTEKNLVEQAWEDKLNETKKKEARLQKRSM